MNFIEWADAKTRHLDVYDLALIKASCLAGGIFLARAVPGFRRINPKLMAVITLALAAKPALTALRAK